MKLPVSYIFLPAQELTVRVAAVAQALTRRQPPVWVVAASQECEHRVTRNKYRGRTKNRRPMLQLETV